MKRFLRRQPRVKIARRSAPPQQALGRLLGYVTRYRGAMALVVLLLMVGTASTWPFPTCWVQGINNLSGGKGWPLPQPVLLMVAAAVVSWLLLVCRGRCWQRHPARHLRPAPTGVSSHANPVPELFRPSPIGELMSSVSNDTEVVAQFFRTSLGMLSERALKLVFIILAMVLAELALAIAALRDRAPGLGFLGFGQPHFWPCLCRPCSGNGRTQRHDGRNRQRRRW
jgi:ABC-type multidrug transport system fused ATPase/permease subunit